MIMPRGTQLLLVAMCALVPVTAFAQTGISLRTRSLGASFSGVLDDYLTDVFLNPARVSALDRSMVSTYRRPGRSIAVPFPTQFSFFRDNLPVEASFFSYSVWPIGASYFASAGKLAMSLAVEAYIDDDDRFSAGTDVDAFRFSAEVRTVISERVNSRDIEHYAVDWAVATKGTGRYLGARITATHNRFEDRDGDVRITTRTALDGSGNVTEDFTKTTTERVHERTVVDVSIGVHRAGGRVRDVVFGGGVDWERLDFKFRAIDIFNEDVDGNGQDLRGAFPTNEFDENGAESHRDYAAGHAFARVHFSFGGNVRSAHAVSWRHSPGDGNGGFRDEEEVIGDSEAFTLRRADYVYDGTLDEISVESAVAYSAQVGDVLFAFGARGRYARIDFDEDGIGDAALVATGADNPISGTFASTYTQRHDNSDETFELKLPVGLEWEFHRYAKLRMGFTLFARHTDSEKLSTQVVDALTTQGVFALPGVLQNPTSRLQSDTGVAFSNGLEIHVDDRFVLDLFAGSSRIDLVDFVYVSGRYRF